METIFSRLYFRSFALRGKFRFAINFIEDEVRLAAAVISVPKVNNAHRKRKRPLPRLGRSRGFESIENIIDDGDWFIVFVNCKGRAENRTGRI
ncbi:MAG: hypothetical protein IPJ25_03870 [Rhodocyclaceae bacterium]|nr:hypothetical protein [Rhodocyclaceae bacterium]